MNTDSKRFTMNDVQTGVGKPRVKATSLFNCVNFIPEEIHVLATRLATYVSSDSTTAKVNHR
jgi:hypothetical protein